MASRVRGVDAEEAVRVVAGRWHLLPGARVAQRRRAVRVGRLPLAKPVGRNRIVVVLAERTPVVAESAGVGTVTRLPLLRALRHVVLDRQMIDPDLAADAVLAGVVDHHVLDDPDAARVRLVDQILIGGVRRFQSRIDARPVVGMVAVVVEAGPVLHGRRNPDGGEAEIADVVEALDEAAEVAAPVRVDSVAGGVEVDAIAAEEIIGRIAVVEAGGDDEVDRLLAEVDRRFDRADVVVEALPRLVARAVDDEKAHGRRLADRQRRTGEPRRRIALRINGGRHRRFGAIQRVVGDQRRGSIVGERKHDVDRLLVCAVALACRDLRSLQVRIRIDGVGERAGLPDLAGRVDADRHHRRCHREGEWRLITYGRCCRRVGRPIPGFAAVDRVPDRVVGVLALQRHRLRPIVETRARRGTDDGDGRPLRVQRVPGVVRVEPALALAPEISRLPAGAVVEDDAGRLSGGELVDEPVVGLGRHRDAGPGGRRVRRRGVPIMNVGACLPAGRALEVHYERHVRSP